MDLFDFAVTKAKLFPLVIQLMYVGSMAMYLLDKNYQQALYWFAAFLITFSVTWFKP